MSDSAPSPAFDPAGDASVGLMREAARGSEAAFAALVRQWQGILLNLFRKLGARQDEAEDAVQETFLRIHAYRNRYRPTASFRTFLFTVARRSWLDLRRRQARHVRRAAPDVEVEHLTGSEGIALTDRIDLQEGLESLPEGQRLVLVLSVHGGLRYDEIASVLDIPVGTVKSRVFHALRKLRAREHDDVRS